LEKKCRDLEMRVSALEHGLKASESVVEVLRREREEAGESLDRSLDRSLERLDELRRIRRDLFESENLRHAEDVVKAAPAGAGDLGVEIPGGWGGNQEESEKMAGWPDAEEVDDDGEEKVWDEESGGCEDVNDPEAAVGVYVESEWDRVAREAYARWGARRQQWKTVDGLLGLKRGGAQKMACRWARARGLEWPIYAGSLVEEPVACSETVRLHGKAPTVIPYREVSG
jgi:hypothetical protein